MHPAWRRCSSFRYSRYPHSSRLATRAPRPSRCDAAFSPRAPYDLTLPRGRARRAHRHAAAPLRPRAGDDPVDRAGGAADAGDGRPRLPRRLRAGASPAQGAARHRRRDRRGARPDPRHQPGRGRAERLRQRVPRSRRRGPPRARRRRRGRAGARAAPARRQDDRRAHGDQPEQGRPHRPPAQHHAGRHAGAAAALRRRAGGGAELHRRHRRAGRRRRGRLRAPRAQDARGGTRDRRLDALRLLLLGSLRPRHRVVRRRSRAPVGAQRDAARHRARRQRHRGARGLRRRSHRPDPPRDDGAPERRLRPPDVGGRHPAPEILGDRLRPAARERHDVQADRGQAGGLLGDADRGGSDRDAGRSTTPTADAAGRRRRAARKGDRPIGRHRHLRRQGHRLPVPGSSACSGRTSTTGPSARASPATRCGRRRRRPAAIGPTGRRSAAPMPSTT